MKQYNVVFAINYKLTAESEKDAQEQAEKLFVDEIDNLHCGLTEVFGCHIDEGGEINEINDRE